MSAEYLFLAVKTELNIHKKMILILLADLSGDTGQSWPSKQYLVQHSGMSRRTLMSYLRELEEEGFIKIDPHYTDGQQVTNHYTLSKTKLVSVKIKKQKGGRELPRGRELPTQGGESCPARGARAAPNTLTDTPIDTPSEKLFENAEVNGAWGEWETYRKQLKKTLTPASITKQVNFLADLSDLDKIAAINQSIMNGWTGLFAPKGNMSEAAKTSTGAQNKGRLSQADRVRAAWERTRAKELADGGASDLGSVVATQ